MNEEEGGEEEMDQPEEQESVGMVHPGYDQDMR
jgi:hypothetical protein